MLRSIIVSAVFWLYLLFSVLLFPLVLFLSIPGLREWRERALILMCNSWGRLLFWVGGVDITLKGIENVPDHNRICFVSNHQSICDIALILGHIKKKIGFIARKEVGRVPVLVNWMKILGCIIINRESGSGALRAIESGMDRVELGNSIVLFPEGTRARDGRMREFKSGGVLMAARRNITLVPLTIDGLYRAYEHQMRFAPCKVSLTIHPPIEPMERNRQELKALPKQLEEIVRSGVTIHE